LRIQIFAGAWRGLSSLSRGEERRGERQGQVRRQKKESGETKKESGETKQESARGRGEKNQEKQREEKLGALLNVSPVEAKVGAKVAPKPDPEPEPESLEEPEPLDEYQCISVWQYQHCDTHMSYIYNDVLS